MVSRRIDSPPTAPRPRLRRLAAVLPSVVGGAVVAALLVGQWPRARATLADADLGWLAAAVGLAALGMLVLAAAWADVLALVADERPRRAKVAAAYFAGELGKYVPGGVWAVLGRGEATRRLGVSRPAAYASVLLSLVLAYAANAVAAAALAVALLLRGDGSPAVSLLPLAFPAALVGLHPAVLSRVLGWLRRVTRRPLDVRVPPWRRSLAVAARYLPAWACIGLSTWAVARALVPDPGVVRIWLAAVLSWLAGFVAGPAPAGAGVREAVFVAACGLPAGEAVAVAVAARAVTVAVDAAGGAASLAFLQA
ncbi:MAG TPA: lysylphosphatidylglycerol synthase domain-containing protein [Acidimicrobiales bacterium]|jgi:uncharacterized membrane protein YbhN (UPF0104 family)|nr:lysylphosphatidylglycerol synthase domain-containing protein [Acidimicrobiales bacterium]